MNEGKHTKGPCGEIQAWENENLTELGHYKGRMLRGFGFPYRIGEYVPVDKRYSAMAAHRWALAAFLAATQFPRGAVKGGW